MTSAMSLNCFKAYDIRGRIPDQLNTEVAYRIGRAYGQFIRPRTVVIGFDVRLDSPALALALSKGLTDSGSDVINIGMCGTKRCISRHSIAALTAASW